MSTAVGWARAVAVASSINTSRADEKSGRRVDESLVRMSKELVITIGTAHGETESFEALKQQVHSAKGAGRQSQEPYAICIDPGR